MTANLISENDQFTSLVEKQDENAVKRVINDMFDFARGLVVDSEAAYKSITSIYAQAREWKKVVEARRKQLVEPYRKQISTINDRAKELSDPLDNVIDLANAKTNDYQKLLAERKRLEDEELLKGAALFDAQDEIYIPPIEKIIRGDGAIAVTKTHIRFKVTDISKVPLKYLAIDETAVKQAIKLGIMEIAGIEVYEEQETQLRIR